MIHLLDLKQKEKLGNFLKKHCDNSECCSFHKNNKPYYGAIGGRLTYHFTPTSLGITTKVSCACDFEIDLTDYESW